MIDAESFMAVISVMDAISVVRGAFLLMAGLIIVLYKIPAFRLRLFDYGPRSAVPAAPKAVDKKSPRSSVSLPIKLLDQLAALLVPHSWFTSFYVVSTASSLFWGTEILRKGPAFQLVAEHVPANAPRMSITQVQLAWTLMLAQGGRRLYESLTLGKGGSSTMWAGHWIIGMAFYVGVGVAVWMEGAATLAEHSFGLADLQVGGPSIKSFFGILIFIFASGVQHDCHSYLASLKSKPASTSSQSAESSPKPKDRYVLPDHPAWSLSLTPHYFAECMIYLALAVLAAPQGRPVNLTVLSALTFVAVNLGITADGTREWYRRKFGDEAIGGRARMITGIW